MVVPATIVGDKDYNAENNAILSLRRKATGVFRVVTECHCGPTKGSESPFATEDLVLIAIGTRPYRYRLILSVPIG